MDIKNLFRKSSGFALQVKSEDAGYLHAFIHPCVINNRPHIIYPRGLEEKSPGLFTKLRNYYQQQGYTLKEDQRAATKSGPARHERRKWFPVLLFTASLMFESSACADVEIEIKDSLLNHQKHDVELQLISNQDIRQKIQTRLQHKFQDQVSRQTNIKSGIARSLYNILLSRYQEQENDPGYIVDDLKQVANYYSEFPEAVSLLEELKDKNWQLTFDEDNWVTTGSGNMLQVDKAVIHFNTRSAAQLRLNNRCENNPVCIASPADALLHELLHAHSMLVKSEEFIAQGGMNNVVYPYKHEYAVIDAERELYALMSRQDKIKRPQRREHTGRMVKAHCPTCIK